MNINYTSVKYINIGICGCCYMTCNIVIDEGHRGRRVGFQESIRMYLTFDEDDSIEEIVDWLFTKIEDKINTLLVAGETVLVNENDILIAIKKETYLRIGTVPEE